MKRIFLCLLFILSFGVVHADGCDALLTREAAQFIKDIVTLVRIAVPILLIVLCSSDFVSIVTGQDEKVTKTAISRIIKRFICAAAFFFVPLILQLILGIDAVNNALNLVDDPTCGIDGDLDGYKSEEEIQKETEERLEEERKKKEEEEKKKKEEEEKKKQEENKSSVGAGTKTIFIGDSRTVGMCAAVTGSYSNCSFDSAGRAKQYSSTEYFVSQGSAGFTWFNTKAVPEVNRLLANDPNTTYNIVSYMGVNWLLSEISKYESRYAELAKGDWKKHNIILVSVNPVNEAVEAQNGYKVKQANIIEFNKRLKAITIPLSNTTYCDTYNKIINNFSTSDGLHYTSTTSKNIYNHTKTCITNTAK